ncbi:sensor domain-containing diguanylate cyclase [Pantoea phytobeneficialis]|uniref:Sensor domain-containing phosphodiesterase n=1 Tax=Pantoea phytobeneficialis TaxID=2052056 RepID=A0AAP9KRR6_9GAMM|nr:sensor domain-containing phosphodiesterase [Pantoea phytobeneficialis]MDO6406799.1 sensor domain-containing phosphodiesterase [Pantoea phytobeneficialis]QGR09325.1 sensor domain-containing phosphodiesterase [Pantoea phytobeneficialis]
MYINDSSEDGCQRLALQVLRDPDESRDDVLRKFTSLVSKTLGIPSSFISVMDDDHQYIKVAHNFLVGKTARVDSMCQYVVDGEGAMIVHDTWQDPRFANNPFVVGEPFVRFYAGVPLTNREGMVLGSLCVVDRQSHPFSPDQVNTLKLLAELVMSFLEAWHAVGYTDPVTGLPNRQRLIRDLQSLASSGDNTPRRLVLIDCIDMPRAYELARSLGMAPVEGLLKDVATLLPLRLRPGNDALLYTIATGRFAVLTKQDGRLSAAWVATRLEGISADMGEGLSVDLTTHTGETDFIPSRLSAHEILRRSVSALHEAICRGVPAMSFSLASDERRTEDFTLVNDLASALKHDRELYLVYQPKICLQSGEPLGLEALIRWAHPIRGELAPAEFIPLAEPTTLIEELTVWVVTHAIDRLKRLKHSAIQLPITVNVSVRDFSKKGFADWLEKLMIDARLPTSLLGIECLETERIIESPAAIDGLEMLKLRGFGISLDDFGTGYSNISYLRRMPLDVIKLDRSIINGLSTDTASRIITKSIISMLKELDYMVLAEGVENMETLEALKEFGCDQAQGYFYSHPLREEELDNWLAWKLRNVTCQR